MLICDFQGRLHLVEWCQSGNARRSQELGSRSERCAETFVVGGSTQFRRPECGALERGRSGSGQGQRVWADWPPDEVQLNSEINIKTRDFSSSFVLNSLIPCTIFVFAYRMKDKNITKLI